MELWQVKFSLEYQNEYCMQWVDEEHATPTELQRRKEREEWEAENVEESSS
jgi:hypothetical protein